MTINQKLDAIQQYKTQLAELLQHEAEGLSMSELVQGFESYQALHVTCQDVYAALTYSELVQLKNESQLVPGGWYRITDYQTVTSQENTQSAGHGFDVLVMAYSNSELLENAYAVRRADDTYFENSHLSSWKLRYSIDNDSARFGWASSSGTGVIYQMTDEFENTLPYDFKNIQFLQGETYKYTFDLSGADASLNLNLQPDDIGVIENNIRKCVNSQNVQILNNLVFTVTNGEDTIVRTAGNTFGANCRDMSFGDQFYSNQFGNGCYGNAFGANCSSNRLRSYCADNVFGDDCSKNSLDDSCEQNTFGDDCVSNTLGNENSNNAFGSGCKYNSVGNECHDNVLGSNCTSNVFRNSCIYIRLGNYAQNNTFMNWCRYVKCLISDGTTACDYVHNCTFDEGVSYFYINFASHGTSSAPHTNITFNKGLGGTSSADIVRFNLLATGTPYSPGLKRETIVIAVDSSRIYVRILFNKYVWKKASNEYEVISVLDLSED